MLKTIFTYAFLALLLSQFSSVSVSAETESSGALDLNDPEKIRSFQTHLKRVGCLNGSVDGIWGRETSFAAAYFASKKGLLYFDPDYIDEKFLNVLKLEQNTICKLSLCPQDSESWNNCFGYVEDETSRMWAEIKDGEMQALLIETYDQFKSSGTIKDGKYNGIGTKKWSDGSIYVGEWEKGEMTGQGVYTWSDGGEYKGTFKNGLRHGKGVHSWANRDRYSGEWEKGEATGSGVYTWPDGSKYVGTVKKGLQHGQGTFSTEHGFELIGSWKNGVVNGTATAKWPSGEWYSGNWRAGKQDGDGVLIIPRKGKYSGSWRQGKRHGKGEHTWTDGTTYSGDWQNDKPNGKGSYIGADNSARASTLNFKRKGISLVQENNELTVFYVYAGSAFEKVGVRQGDIIKRVNGKPIRDLTDPQIDHLFSSTESHIVKVQIKRPAESPDLPLSISYTLNGWPSPQSTFLPSFENIWDVSGDHTGYPGFKYSGEWHDGIPHGMGSATLLDGSSYVGQFETGQPEGYGTFYDRYGQPVKKGVWISGSLVREQEQPTNDVFFDPEAVPVVSSGTGFAVSSTGIIITNYHVIDDCHATSVSIGNSEYRATLLARDIVNDLAALQISTETEQYLEIAKEPVQLLQDVIVAGFPFSEDLSSDVKVTRGVISSVTGVGDNSSVFQIDAAVQPGNSGGPVINDRGQVVGVAVAKLDFQYIYEKYGVAPEGVNFAIKSSVASTFLERYLPPSQKLKINNVKSSTELGKILKNSTYPITCWGE